MKRVQGLQHQTSWQTAQEQPPSKVNLPSQVAGSKRSWSAEDPPNQSNVVTIQPQINDFRKATSMLRAPSRLQASRITRPDQYSKKPSEYSQRCQIAATPTSTLDPQLTLSHPVYALPKQLVANFLSLGIKNIYPWQKKCLLGPGLLAGDKNLVYCAPTGGGKSLVADCEKFSKWQT